MQLLISSSHAIAMNKTASELKDIWLKAIW